MAAVSKLKVLNLFTKVEPLLHIDHPVTPYKAEELERNYSQFLSATNFTDLESFCARVFTGKDFSAEVAMAERSSALMSLPSLLKRKHQIPLEVDEVLQVSRIVERRSANGTEANPKQVVLHGSSERSEPAQQRLRFDRAVWRRCDERVLRFTEWRTARRVRIQQLRSLRANGATARRLRHQGCSNW